MNEETKKALTNQIELDKEAIKRAKYRIARAEKDLIEIPKRIKHMEENIAYINELLNNLK